MLNVRMMQRCTPVHRMLSSISHWRSLSLALYQQQYCNVNVIQHRALSTLRASRVTSSAPSMARLVPQQQQHMHQQPHPSTIIIDFDTKGESDNGAPSSDGKGDSTEKNDSSSSTTGGSNKNDAAVDDVDDDDDDDDDVSVDRASMNDCDIPNMTPREIVKQLDRHIIGQSAAKRAVAIAFRDRWRRLQIESDEARKEITPNNVLMVGPTGCGKTEIARRLAELYDIPFIKVEATKFTEVGYHGKDVESIIPDLVRKGQKIMTERHKKQWSKIADRAVNKDLLRHLMGNKSDKKTLNSFLALLKKGNLDDQIIEIEVREQPDKKQGKHGPQAVLFSLGGQGPVTRKKKMTIKRARPILRQQILEDLIDDSQVKESAIKLVEEQGIVFIDEIDKIVVSSDSMGTRTADASDEGVQRDLLPIIEGSVVQVGDDEVKTDHILFIGSGAFHAVKPKDILPELQGRLPIRVDLQAMSEDDLYAILTKTEHNLVQRQQMLLATEDVELCFEDDALRHICVQAMHMNKNVEDIGVRRLATIIQKICEDISFYADDYKNQKYTVTKDKVNECVGDMTKVMDLTKYIL